jgi:septal ring-binding cell division protein DamX
MPKKKKDRVEIKKRTLLWGGVGFVIVIAWVFILGILVGRGDLSYVEVKDKFADISGITDESPGIDSLGKMDDNLKLDFYEELASKKEAAARKNHEPKKPRPKPRLANPLTTSENNQRSRPESIKGYLLQIGSFKEKTKAKAFVKRLKEKKYPAFYSSAKVDGKTYYRVKCGPFDTENKADAFKKVLAKNENIHGFVTRAN